jgi:pimeloyl-ACP methyl ester carboxylesterase
MFDSPQSLFESSVYDLNETVQLSVTYSVLIDSTPEDYRERFLPTMSQDFQQVYNKQFIYEGNYDEVMESLKQVKETKLKLNVPLIVLSAGKKAHYSRESQELWYEMQREIFEISSNGEWVIAENSGHYIQEDEPEVVVSAIKKLIDIHEDERFYLD